MSPPHQLGGDGDSFEDRYRRSLIQGLVRDREYLYQTSASFHAAVDQLVGMLPLWLDFLAARAQAEDEAMTAALDALRQPIPEIRAVTLNSPTPGFPCSACGATGWESGHRPPGCTFMRCPYPISVERGGIRYRSAETGDAP